MCSSAKGTPAEVQEAHTTIQAGLQSGALRPVVGTCVPIEQAADAHRAVIEQSGGAKGKIVLTMQ